MKATGIVVRKDMFTPSRPWCADVEFDDSPSWMSWCSGFKTLKALNRHIDATVAEGLPRTRQGDVI